MPDIVASCKNKLLRLEKFLHHVGQPVSDLLVRLVTAWIFFKSGWLKLNYYFDGNWDMVIYLFTEEHPVPFLPPEIAAVMGTAAETILPVLLAIGLFPRLAAMGLIAVTGVIISTGIAPFTLAGQMEHITWIALLSVVLVRGGRR